MPGATPSRVLVVDDDSQYRALVVRILEGLGLEVDQAPDGLAALEQYSQGRRQDEGYDLVLLDLSLPVMDGRECLRRLLEMDKKARVLITSGHDPRYSFAAGEQDLAAGFLQKPFDLKEFLAMVQNLLTKPL
ncbi:hypothetical protein AAU61_16680 [Desulfocarbo indianensis]|nr:hypothetical protein AAU61_16680 [Desulfocarbo indianensis]